MEKYFNLFESVVQQQAVTVGAETAYAQAERAGLTLTTEGRIVGFDDAPQLVLLRLIKSFTEGGNVASLMACGPLIEKILAEFPAAQPEDA